MSLKEVNSYSSASLKGVRQFEEIDYSFKTHCTEQCQLDAIKRFEIKRTEECACVPYVTADSVTLIIYTAIRDYFDGLVRLSDNKLTKFDYEGLEQAITVGNFGKVSIEEADVKSYGTIASLLIRAATDGYRSKKLSEYIEVGNPAIKVLLDKFRFILQENLEGELHVKKEWLYGYYKEMSFSEHVSDYERGRAISDYYQQLTEINDLQHLIDVFANNLSMIAKGHQELYNSRRKLNARRAKTLAVRAAADIRELIGAFKNLKN